MGILKKQLLLLPILYVLMFSGVVTAAPIWKLNQTLYSEMTIKIVVREAYYSDLDSDGFEDDVYIRTELLLEGANRYNFDYWLTLTLPSGVQFIFGWGINTRLNFLNIGNNLMNTALEPGWYDLHVEVIMKTGGISYTNTMHTFDPPGSGDTNVPPAYASITLL